MHNALNPSRTISAVTFTNGSVDVQLHSSSSNSAQCTQSKQNHQWHLLTAALMSSYTAAHQTVQSNAQN